MAMLCCSNGSLTRDAVRRACLGESATWEDVDAAVAAAVAEDGTPTRVAACFLTVRSWSMCPCPPLRQRLTTVLAQPEITPRVSACGAVLGEYDTTAWRGAPVAAMAVGVEGVPAFLQRLLSAAEARGWEPRHVLAAVALGHALSLRAHAERLGVGACDRVVVAGGASASRALVQVRGRASYGWQALAHLPLTCPVPTAGDCGCVLRSSARDDGGRGGRRRRRPPRPPRPAL